ncbi:hypothetical protein [Klenkia soli]|uniref:hypothetical protein n=1 Tax=Klenkia soli TaxID=1052260 RepID=UPI001A958ACD|nr:hypothetical protein [Klenkia soli]
MTLWLFPDNTVLCNFAAVGELDLLRDILRDRGRWTEAVEQEARKSGNYLPALRSPIPWLGEPIAVEDEDSIGKVERIRRGVFGGGDDRPTQHLGEAQTCFILRTSEFTGSCWISDDRDAFDFAQRQGILTRKTWQVLAEGVAGGDVSSADAYEMLEGMAAAGRNLLVPTRPEFEAGT